MAFLSFSPAQQWLKGLVQKYYAAHPVSFPHALERREFGHGTHKKIDQRHVSFETVKEFNHFLQNNSPLYVSASVSQYINPAAQPMDNKGWLGSDLIYEFDADEIPTDCKKNHDSWSCSHCGEKGKGRVLKCTRCAKGTSVKEWVCPACLGAAKQKTVDLISVLQSDFSFENDSIVINFSGSKGYHIHVRSPAIFSLPKSARIELMDYLSLHELDLALLGFSFDGKAYRCPPYLHAVGHVKRILERVQRMMISSPPTDWAIYSGAPQRIVNAFLENREEWSKDILTGILPALPGKKTESFWNNVLSNVADELRLPFDRQTSGDMYRLIRVPDTIHGTTCFVAKTIPFDQLGAFDPFTDALSISPTAPKRKLFVQEAPTIRVGTETLDALSQKEVTVSLPLAAYLVGNHAAELR